MTLKIINVIPQYVERGRPLKQTGRNTSLLDYHALDMMDIGDAVEVRWVGVANTLRSAVNYYNKTRGKKFTCSKDGNIYTLIRMK